MTVETVQKRMGLRILSCWVYGKEMMSQKRGEEIMLQVFSSATSAVCRAGFTTAPQGRFPFFFLLCAREKGSGSINSLRTGHVQDYTKVKVQLLRTHQSQLD
jgi:hypothetical protein